MTNHRQRRDDAAQAVQRLEDERRAILDAQAAFPAEIEAASAAAADAAEKVAEIERTLSNAMEAAASAGKKVGEMFAAERMALADARSQLVETRSRLDRVTRTAAEAARRLDAIAGDITAWRRRHDQAAAVMAEQGDVTVDPGPQVYGHISEANQQGFADAAEGEPLFPDADPDYAAGWHSFHRQREASAALLRAMGQPVPAWPPE